MAIQFARARYISRSSGGSAVRSAAYNARDVIEAERTGELFYFKHRDTPEHHEVLLPEGASERLRDCAVLWNVAEAAERRRDAQVAREIVLALPSNAELTNEDRIALARDFAQTHFVSKGLAIQLDVHAPHEAGEGDESERANWHAHLLISTRRVEGEGFAAKKARDLDPVVRRAGRRAVVTDGEAWGELWRAHQDRYFQENGLGIRVDPTALHAGEHVGPVRMRKAGSAAFERAETLRSANQEAARDPEQVLAALTRNNATFTERELDRFLAKHVAPEEVAGTRKAVLGSADVLALHERDTGAAVGRFTTRQVRMQEQAALRDGEDVAAVRHQRGVSRHAAEAAAGSRSLRPDQRAAFDHAVASGGLAIIEGRAGTGKSYTLATVREAHEQDGRRVVGLAPTNAVAQDLKADGFTEAGTVHAELFRLKNGRTIWDKRTVVIVDEAAMLDSRVTGELLAEAKASGAKVILAGDDRQLASIERGGLFTELRQRHGSAEINEITRQRVDWQRQAARDLAEGRFEVAVASYDQAGAITWTAEQDGARAALVAAWTRDTAAEPEATRFVFAYTNRDVDALNVELRQVRRERGELGSPDVALETKHGIASFAVGDRVQFTDTDKRARIYNGNVGTITSLDARTGEVRAVLDGAGGEGREVSWSADTFQGFRHGYAGTIYKGQGKTLDHTYLYHTEHWRSAASYVALTRQRESAQVFVAKETARDTAQLARQMARGEVKAASVAWATVDELPVGLRLEAKLKPEQQAPRQDEKLQPAASGVAAEVTKAATQPARQDADEWLLAPFIRADGRDSLGRGLDGASVLNAVDQDRQVQREREAQQSYLRGSYRDPEAAKAQLDEVVAREGWTSTAARLRQDPEQLGALRGKVGLFAGATGKQERFNALRTVEAVAANLERIGVAEGQAQQGYRSSVTAQLQADATPVPKLSEAAARVISVLGRAADDAQAAETWRIAMGDAAIGGELQRFQAAVRQRFGEDGTRMLYRAGRQAGVASHPSVPKLAQEGLDQISRVTSKLAKAERQHAEVQRQVERAAQRQGPRMRM